MKKILLLLLLPFATIAQDTLPDINAGRLFIRETLPIERIDKFLGQRDILITGDSKSYMWKWNKYHEIPLPIGKGEKGDQGIQGIKGDTGDCSNCPSGVGSFPFLIVIGTSNSTTDESSLNAAITSNKANNKPIYLVGNILAGDIIIPADSYRLTMFGYGSKWTIRTGATHAMKRVAPANNTEANLQIIARFIIEGVEFFGTSSQAGLEMGPSYNSQYRNLKFNSLAKGNHLRFALNTRLEFCEYTNCLIGDIADYGNWTGATTANSQSNNTVRIGNRYYMPPAGQIASASYAASGNGYEGCIFEGHKALQTVVWDWKLSTVVRDFYFKHGHVETAQGNSGCASGEAYFYLRGVGNVVIDGVFSQYAGCFINAGASPGNMTLQVLHVPWIVKPADGKIFVNAGNVWWDFISNEAFWTPANFTANWHVGAVAGAGGNGVSTTLSGGFASGINKWTMTGRGFTTGIYNYDPAVARMVVEEESSQPYKLTLVMKTESIQSLRKIQDAEIVESIMTNVQGAHVYYFDTYADAQYFASHNPDFNATIVKE